MEIESKPVTYNVKLTQEEIDFIHLITGYVSFDKDHISMNTALRDISTKIEDIISPYNYEEYGKLFVEPDEFGSFVIKFKEDI